MELHLVLDRSGGLRAQVESGLRDAIRDGRLAPGVRLPPTRLLSADLGVSRGVIVEAYAQLTAEGYLVTARGGGTRVAPGSRALGHHAPGRRGGAATEDRTPARQVEDGAWRDLSSPKAARFDLRPSLPALDGFPRTAWAGALGRVLRTVPDARLGYGDPRGEPELRVALARSLGRTRGLRADPEQLVITGGVRRALPLALALLAARGVRRVGVEEPGWPRLPQAVRAAGLQPVAVPVDADGLIPAAAAAGGRLTAGDGIAARAAAAGAPAIGASLAADRSKAARAAPGGAPAIGAADAGAAAAGAGLAAGADDAVVEAIALTPAHQFPTGAVLAPARRAALVAWARDRGAWLFEDDYDAEFRYDRAPVGSLQGLAPDRVLHAGSVSKSIAPALRLGWLVLPPELAPGPGCDGEATWRDPGAPGAVEQLAFADLLERGDVDRHLRRRRREYAARRAALLAALAAELPDHEVTGAAAGLFCVLQLPPGTDEAAVLAACAAAGLALEGGRAPRPALALGYAALHPAAAPAAARALRDVLSASG